MDLLLHNQETKRLKFRTITLDDFETWLPFHQDPRSMQYWEGLSENPKRACQEWFDRLFHRYENNLGGMNALIDKSSGRFIGQCGLLIQEVDGMQEVEIGYSILPSHWRQGYATEAAIKCKEFAFANKLADSLISIIHIDNIPSQKVALANGMELQKTTTYKDNPVHIFRIAK